MKFFQYPLLVLFVIQSVSVLSQGRISGDLMMNTSLYERDSSRGAYNTAHYDNLMSSVDAWLTLNYAMEDFSAGVRFDLFNNSNLHNPGQAYTDEGIGTWYIRKKVKKLTITGGYFYDQYGSGAIFRAYENRGLGIDNSIYGVNLKYDLHKNWTLKGFAGRQKNRFTMYEPVIKGANVEGYVSITDKVKWLPGFGVVNRTMDQGSMNNVVSTVAAYDVADRFIPTYNVFFFSGYETWNVGDFEFYTESAFKTAETIVNSEGKLVKKPGYLTYATLTYSKKGFGITGQAKRTENFTFRTSPNEVLLNGLVNFLPPLTRQNSWRLTSRYAAAAQDLGEQAYQIDVIFTPIKKLNVQLNGSYVTDLSGLELFKEYYAEFKYKASKKLIFVPGLQIMEYNQEAYIGKGDKVETITPFLETTYKITRKKSLRVELSYLKTEQDYGKKQVV